MESCSARRFHGFRSLRPDLSGTDNMAQCSKIARQMFHFMPFKEQYVSLQINHDKTIQYDFFSFSSKMNCKLTERETVWTKTLANLWRPEAFNLVGERGGLCRYDLTRKDNQGLNPYDPNICVFGSFHQCSNERGAPFAARQRGVFRAWFDS